MKNTRKEQRDKTRKEQVEVRNAADSAIFTAEKALRDGGDKVPAEVKSEVEGKIASTRSALEGSDMPAIQAATNDLYQSIQKIGSAMYQSGPEAGAPGGDPGAAGGSGPTGGASGDDVVDGQFKEA